MSSLSEQNKINCFLSCLKDEIRLPVKMFSPINLGVAFGLAKIQEECILSSRRSWRNNRIGVNSKANELAVSSRFKPIKYFNSIKKISSAHMDEKRKKGLRYHCDEK